MAVRYAVASGNWSNTATWDGGTLPTSADDVYADGNEVAYDKSAVQAYVDAHAYIAKRQAEYPPITDYIEYFPKLISFILLADRFQDLLYCYLCSILSESNSQSCQSKFNLLIFSQDYFPEAVQSLNCYRKLLNQSHHDCFQLFE